MKQRWVTWVRHMALASSAGVCFQAMGCLPGNNELLAGLTVSVVNSFLTDLVFGAFNLVP